MADAFYGPRSRENARLLLKTARDLGIDTRHVRTQVGGYLVPEEITDAINEAQAAERAEREAAEAEAQAAAEAEKEKAHEANSLTGDAGPRRPSQADSKADWLAYAEAVGADVTDENTKAEIVEAAKKKAEEETD